jgi:hypothetical protein
MKTGWTLIGLAFFLIALAVGYHFVIYIPQKDKAQIDLQKQKIQKQEDIQSQKKQQAEDNKQALNSCLEDAESNYSKNWRNNCRSRGALPNGCDEDTIYQSFEDYQKQNNLTGSKGLAEYLKYSTNKEEECTCSLPMVLADSVNGSLKQEKDICFKQYPQN